MNANSIFEYVNFLENHIKELEYDESVCSTTSTQESLNTTVANVLYSLCLNEKDEKKRKALKIATDVVQNLEYEIGEKNINEYIATNLESIAQTYENPYKCNAYMKAAESIREYPYLVTSGKELAKGPNKIPGIGKSIAKKIDHLISKW